MVCDELIYLHDLSSKLENPGIPDRPVCDDGWFDTYGYIFSNTFVTVVVIGDVGASDAMADVVEIGEQFFEL